MITRKTVLVLGAGASADYGFPVGNVLKENIVGLDLADPKDGSREHCLRTAICSRGHDVEEFKNFQAALRMSGQPSVDSFLERRQEFMSVGLLAIASCLAPCEQTDRLFPKQGRDPGWYQMLFSALGWSSLKAGLGGLALSNLTIVTFNYDRSLEHYLATALSHSYNVPRHECAAKLLQAAPVHHVYGMLGGYPVNPRVGREYTEQLLDPADIQQAAGGISIVHEGSWNDEAFSLARDALREAEVVCFLGFGYAEINLERLTRRKVVGGVPKRVMTDGHCEVFGTALRLGGTEKKRVMAFFGSEITLGAEKIGSKEFLREHPVFA